MKEDKESTASSRKERFIAWVLRDCPQINVSTDERTLLECLSCIGVKVDTLYCETDPIKVRMIASELVMKRQQLVKERFSDYTQQISRLLAYAEFLELGSPEVDIASTGMPNGDIVDTATLEIDLEDNLYQSLTFAYYLSRLNDKAVKSLGCSKFTDAFDKIGALLSRKPSTIKNMRDEFDPYFENGRRGWYQRELRNSRKEIFDAYRNIDDDELSEIVISLFKRLNKDEAGKSNVQDHDNSLDGERKKIRINPEHIKEIKVGKRQRR